MRVAHALCDDGITAELWLGALVDAGVPPEELQAPIDRAGVETRLIAESGEAQEVAATFVRFESEPAAERVDTVAALHERVAAAGLSARAQARAEAIIEQLGEAEAAAHGIPVGSVRLHEIGRPHGIARILAGVTALERLEIDRVTVGAIAVGGGVVRIAHGRFPVPPPAVLHLLRGFVIHGGEHDEELTTPSGAAILAGLAEPVAHIPQMRLEGSGRGAIDTGTRRRMLTVMIGSATE